ncbi:NCS1 nucleoside transporter family protein [Mollisia scopiformis]|uniref:NCS1 nucleoside transporter family protein n=1 Tax=Mollisia scopiformis TaxID=149040 RepID=A0A132B5W2_MOLSC|nr:NCS1 nucleoside transporter family protein [Mollisia scopiformis]KUJ07643.1 NCS1 nucleoside transporter family protein [Mollisia scopiformis]
MGFMERFEVASETELTRWINDDIKPIEAGRRTWTFWTFHNYWILVNSNISTYLTGSSLIALGLTWWQAIISIVIGNILATIFVVLNSVPGAYYHIGFPVVNRYVWGMYGSAFVIWNRILLSLVWYGFQAWIGGECLYVCLMALDPNLEKHIPNHMLASTGMTTAQFVAYIIFSIVSLPVIWIRPHKLKNFFYFSSATILIFEIVLLIWALATMGPEGFGDTISSTPTAEASSTGWLIAYGIISTIGSIAAGILNQNDYARFAHKPRDAILGQIFSFPLYAVICSIIGILVTAATQNRFGGALWNLPDIFTTLIQNGGSRERAAGFFAGAALVISQIGVNVPGNALSGGFDLAATFPRYINIRRGAYLTALVSVACNPWRLVNTATTFISVLGSYSVFFGPMTGLMISSYFIINRQKINVDDLFVGNKQSVYWYTWGVNWRAIVAWICGVAPSMPGFVASVQLLVSVPIGLTHLYYICFLIGFAISSGVYCLLHFIFPAKGLNDFVASSPSPRSLMAEYQERWDGEISGVSDIDKDARVVDREINFN